MLLFSTLGCSIFSRLEKTIMTRLRLRSLLLAIIVFFLMFSFTSQIDPIFGLLLSFGSGYIVYLLLSGWRPFKKAATAGPNAISNNLEGVVRGFKESRQIVNRFINSYQDSEVIVWSFQLERHSETEDRLDPIPVEMRGKNFSGIINEGNVVRLYEKSWPGGIVHTKRVYNVTFKDDIIAHGG